MEVTLTSELEAFIQEKVRSGRYLDPSDVVRDALRRLEQTPEFVSPEIEEMLLEGVRGQHRPDGPEILDEIRRKSQMRREPVS